MTLSKPKMVLACLLALLCAGLLIRYLHRVPKRHYCDFRVYHHTAKVFLARGGIYTDGTQEITPFKYSPFFAFLVCPLGLLPVKSAAAVFFVVNFCAAALLFRLSVKLIDDHGALPPRKAFWIYALSAVFVLRFLFLVWDSGQVPIIICCLVLSSLYFFSRNKDMPAAAFLAAAVLFKYLPAVFIPYFILRRRFKAAGLTVLFLALLLALPAVYAGLAKNTEYLCAWFPTIIRTSLDQGSYFDFKNQSLFSLVLRMFSPSPYRLNLLALDFKTALTAAYVLAFALYLLALLPVKNRNTERLDYALLFVFLPLFNPNGWATNFVALAFPCVVLIAYLQEVRLKDGFVLGCLTAAFVFLTFASQGLAGNSLQNACEASSVVTVGALFFVAALAKLKFSPGGNK